MEKALQHLKTRCVFRQLYYSHMRDIYMTKQHRMASFFYCVLLAACVSQVIYPNCISWYSIVPSLCVISLLKLHAIRNPWPAIFSGISDKFNVLDNICLRILIEWGNSIPYHNYQKEDTYKLLRNIYDEICLEVENNKDLPHNKELYDKFCDKTFTKKIEGIL